MRRVLVSSVVVGVLVAAQSMATTVWNPAANGISPPDAGNWNDALNWAGGSGLPPGDGTGGTDAKAVLNVADAAELQVTDVQSVNQIVQGDNGPGGVIRVMAGGDLSTGPTWTAIGYNDVANLIVETGGTFSFGQHSWIGFNPGAVGTVDINGGTVNVAGMFGLGWNGGDGYVNVNDDGLLALSNIHGDGATSIKQASQLDIIGTGQVTLPGDFEAVIATYAGNGLISGNGIVGNIQTDLTSNPGFTTITAIPEPSTFALIALGLGLAALRRRNG